MSTDALRDIFVEVSDFLVSQPALQDLTDYKVSLGVQQYLDSLLEKNRDGIFSTDERLELEKMLAVSYVMTLAKTKARLKLAL